MAKAKGSVKLEQRAKSIWAKIGDFGDLNWSPGVKSTDMKGKGMNVKRTVVLGDGSEVVETMKDVGETFYTYEGVEVPMPIKNYVGRLEAKPGDGLNCTVTWSSTFDVPDDADEAEVVKQLEGLYQSSLDALK